MIYSCHYPIIAKLKSLATIDPDEKEENNPEDEKEDNATPESSNSYTIHLNNKKIYEGRVYIYTAKQKNIKVDISPICREYLEPYYEKIGFRHPEKNQTVWLKECPNAGNITTIGKFILTPSRGDIKPQEFNVMYNYNTDYKSEYEEAGVLNTPLLLEAHPHQLLTLSAYNLKNKNTYSYAIDGAIPTTATLGKTSNVYQLYTLNLRNLNLNPGQKITINCKDENGLLLDQFTYTIVPEKRNRYVLYYINKNGGLDNLLFKGKHINSFNSSAISGSLYADRSDSKNFQKRKVIQEINKKYQLNTSILEDENASRIDDLIFSPKVWIHNLDQDIDTIVSCTIDETNCTIKNFRNNKITTYQINVTETENYLRK